MDDFWKQSLKDEFLVCRVCLSSFQRPKSLPCLHTFCEQCISVLHDQLKPLRCPICRQVHYLPSEGVSGLPDNFFIASLAERLDAPTQRRLDSVGCETHPDQDLLFFCKEDACCKAVCTRCLLQDHSDHRITPLRQQGNHPEAVTENINSETEEDEERNTDWVTNYRVRQLLRIGENGRGEHPLLQPLDLAYDQFSGRLYVCDAVSQSVLTYDLEGTLLSTWSTKTSEKTSTPSGVALNATSGHLYVTDSSEAVVKVYDKSGKLLRTFGQGFFEKPWGVAIDPQGDSQIAVTDIGRHRVSMHKPDGSVIWTFGAKGKGDSNFQYPHRAAFLPNGHLVVTDYMNHCLKIISNEGTYSRKLYMEETKRLSGPIGVALIQNSQLVLVADDINKQVHVFDHESGRGQVLIDSTDDLSLLKSVSCAGSRQFAVINGCEITLYEMY